MRTRKNKGNTEVTPMEDTDVEVLPEEALEEPIETPEEMPEQLPDQPAQSSDEQHTPTSAGVGGSYVLKDGKRIRKG